MPLLTTDLASAELVKYAANAFLALKISYINEIAQLAEKVGADIAHVARGIGLDARIGTRFLQAGIGWGGSCFGKDTAALVATAAEYNLSMEIVTAARAANARQRERVVEKLLDELKIKSKVYDGQAEPYQDLALGRIDAVLLDEPIAIYYARSNPLLQFMGKPFREGHYVIALRKDFSASAVSPKFFWATARPF